MILPQRIELLSRLGEYIFTNGDELQHIKEKASQANGWFIPEFVNIALKNIASQYLNKDLLTNWCEKYQLPIENPTPKNIGIVMAGNIPAVGFHDLLSILITGHVAVIKLSGKDDVLIKHFAEKLIEWDADMAKHIFFQELLKNCDAYIATGSNNTARYFEYYFSKYRHIIRKTKTSVALLTGHETEAELSMLADDIFLFFGRGCRNVSKIFVPRNYDFVPLINAFKKYNWLGDHFKYKNNYDYNLAIHLVNGSYYMSTEALLLIENETIFTPISQVHYSYYENIESIKLQLASNTDVQCITGSGFFPFGDAQTPSLNDYADGVDTMQFLSLI